MMSYVNDDVAVGGQASSQQQIPSRYYHTDQEFTTGPGFPATTLTRKS